MQRQVALKVHATGNMVCWHDGSPYLAGYLASLNIEEGPSAVVIQ